MPRLLDDIGGFFALAAIVLIVGGSIALPELWLLPDSPPVVPEGVFDTSIDSTRVRQEICIVAHCYTADESRVIERNGSKRRVAWVINPDNPFTVVPVDENGVEENLRIVRMTEVAGTLYVELGSGRTVVRTRDGTWNPGVGEFREVGAPAAALAALGALAVLAGAWLRRRRVHSSTLLIAGLFAIICHLPITIWRFTTAWSLSMVVVPCVALLGVAVAAGFLAEEWQSRRPVEAHL